MSLKSMGHCKLRISQWGNFYYYTRTICYYVLESENSLVAQPQNANKLANDEIIALELSGLRSLFHTLFLWQ
jgi:hypothetical protein